MKYLLIGDRPPPTGGVTIFVNRFYNRLRNDKYNVTSVELGKSNRLKRVLIILYILFYPKKINIFINEIKLDFLKHIIKRKYKVNFVYMNHNDRILKLSESELKIYKSFFKKVNKVILTNEKQLTEYGDLGIDISSKYTILPAFIAPSETELDIKTLPNEILNFIRGHKYVVSANASSLAFHNNQDLYGIDLAISLVNEIVKKYSIVMIYCITKITDAKYFDTLSENIKRLNLQNNILLYTNPIHFPALLKKSDIFIRPTNTDGDSISVREALSLGIPTIASDAVSRNEAVILFKNRNIEDLVLKTMKVIESDDAKPKGEIIDNYKKLIGIINNEE